MAQKKLPSVILRAGEDRRVRAGHPWVFSNEILMDADAKAIGQYVGMSRKGLSPRATPPIAKS